MPNYTYRCPECDSEFMVYHSFADSDEPVYCPDCSDAYESLIRCMKVLGVNIIHTQFGAHYSPTVGQYVSSDRELRDAMKHASEEATLRTGLDHNFVPVDSRDTETLGVTEEGLDATMAAQVRDGKREVAKWL